MAVSSGHAAEPGQDGLSGSPAERALVSRLARSAGGVAFRCAGPAGEVEVALIATRGGTRWQLPKGSCEEGETSVETALREVFEETGLHTEPLTFLRTVKFWYWDTYQKDPPVHVCKMVDFYLLQMTGGQLNDESHEVDGVAWYSLEQALHVLTYETERQVLQSAIEALRQMP